MAVRRASRRLSDGRRGKREEEEEEEEASEADLVVEGIRSWTECAWSCVTQENSEGSGPIALTSAGGCGGWPPTGVDGRVDGATSCWRLSDRRQRVSRARVQGNRTERVHRSRPWQKEDAEVSQGGEKVDKGPGRRQGTTEECEMQAGVRVGGGKARGIAVQVCAGVCIAGGPGLPQRAGTDLAQADGVTFGGRNSGRDSTCGVFTRAGHGCNSSPEST